MEKKVKKQRPDGLTRPTDGAGRKSGLERGRLAALAALGLSALILAGCASGSVNDRRLTRYRPSTADRNVEAWRDPGRVVPSTVGTNVPGRDVAEGQAPGDSVPWLKALHKGDKLTIYLAITGSPQTDKRPDVVDDQGMINLPLIGRIKVEGRTRSEAQTFIERAYVDGGYYKNVSVTIIVEEEDFFVDGEVRRPGRYPMRPGMTLLQAIAAAGGPSEYADKGDTQIKRGNELIRANVSRIETGKDKDVILKPGDWVKVGRTWY